MGGKLFWPVYLIVAAASVAATWVYSPMLGEKLPQSVREPICRLVAVFTGGEQQEEAESPTPEIVPVSAAAQKPAAKPVAVAQPKAVAPAAARVAKSPAAAPAQPKAAPAANAAKAVPAAVQPAQAAVQPKAPVAATAQTLAPETDDDMLPSLRGVEQAVPRKAKWGVLNDEAEIEKLDGTSCGKVAGGRFFTIVEYDAKKSEPRFIGNFMPKPLPYSVSVSADKINCFTGAPENLSERQRQCLHQYYELRGKAQARKREVLRTIALKSPYARETAAALKAFRECAKKVEAAGETASDSNRKATYELSRLKAKFTQLNEKHKQWKQRHASELPDPEKDKQYLKFMEEAAKYSDPIAGLAF